jgi:hypothetical protein
VNKWGTSIASAVATGALALSAFAATLVSGLQPGQHMSQFDVTAVSGPAKGATLCYV